MSYVLNCLPWLQRPPGDLNREGFVFETRLLRSIAIFLRMSSIVGWVDITLSRRGGWTGREEGKYGLGRARGRETYAYGIREKTNYSISLV